MSREQGPEPPSFEDKVEAERKAYERKLDAILEKNPNAFDGRERAYRLARFDNEQVVKMKLEDDRAKREEASSLRSKDSQIGQADLPSRRDGPDASRQQLNSSIEATGPSADAGQNTQ